MAILSPHLYVLIGIGMITLGIYIIKFKKLVNLYIGLGFGMIGIGLYLLTSLFLPAKIEEAMGMYKIGGYKMDILAGLEAFLYVISSSLFYPVVIGLVLLTFWMVISFGSFLREYIERRQGNSSGLSRYKRSLESEIKSLEPASSALLSIRLERLLQSAELELIKSLDKIRFSIRVGPALGLMGTLIPMGISLAALAQADMPKMAGSMVAAFTTTVVGLACGVVAYLISLVKEKWIRADMREMEYLTELIFKSSELKIRNSKMEVGSEVSEEAQKI